MQQTESLASQLPVNNPGIRNEKRLLNLLKQKGDLSQTDLCRLTGLNSSTISYAVGRLRDKSLILEEPGKSRSRGAKPVIIRINPVGLFVVGVEINPSYLLVGLYDFNCQLIDSTQSIITRHFQPPPQQIAELIEVSVRGLLSRHRIETEKVLGVGITISGSISPDGMVNLSSPLGWKKVPLRAIVQKCFGDIPVSVYSTRIRLLSEIDLAGTNNFKNVLYINIANGVGAGVLIDGKLTRGATDRVGEIGHIVIDPDGPECGCGNRGCLEAFVSGPALARRIRHDLAGGGSTLSRVIHDDLIPEQIVQYWGDAIKSGDAYALDLCRMVCDFVSRVAAMTINCFDPGMVMLTGYVSRTIMDPLIQAIQSRIQSCVFDHAGRNLKILPARSGEEALIRGVSTAILHEYLDAE